MRLEDWEPIYERILSDFGYDRSQDESSARMLRALMVNADLMTDDELASLLHGRITIVGGADSASKELEGFVPDGTVISAGSAITAVMGAGIIPDIIVTDLDGDIDLQIEASKKGAVTLIHAHGDNADLIMRYAKEFTGKVVLTTQSRPDYLMRNYGGFTDGDRAYCMVRHFGFNDIRMIGFDYDRPSSKIGSDPSVKLKKLSWAKRIISSYDHDDYD